MRKIFIFLITIYFCNTQNTLSDEYQPYIQGQEVENKLILGNGKYTIQLPPGKFKIISTFERKSEPRGTKIYDFGMATFQGKVLDKYVSIVISKRSPAWWELPKNCKRENLYFYKNYIKGKAFNCWFVNHNTMQLTSDKIKSNSYLGKVKQYIINNGVIVPNIAVYSEHLYSSPRHKNVYFQLRYYENPEISGVPKAESKSWAQSEYQPTKISLHPKKKAFMENYIIKSAKYQRDFETGIGMLPEHRLDTSMAVKKQTLENAKPKSNMVNELSDLNKLYKSGALSKEEFDKAKKKLLN